MLQIYGLGKKVWMAKDDQEEAKEELMQCLKTQKERLETSSNLREISLGLWMWHLCPSPAGFTLHLRDSWKLQHRGSLSQAIAWAKR
ncbi:hypothetical protein CRYUN_Cryun16bG0058000 [Craigia yunnanensis]